MLYTSSYYLCKTVCNVALCKVPLMVFSHQSKTTTRRQDNDKTITVEPVHSYDAFHTSGCRTGVKGIIGMHRFNICLVVVLSLSCSGVKTPLVRSTGSLCGLLVQAHLKTKYGSRLNENPIPAGNAK